MYIKSVLLSATLFHNVIPSQLNIEDPTAIFVNELFNKYPELVQGPQFNLAHSNFNQEIIAKNLGFGPKMPLVDALAITTSIRSDQICSAMLNPQQAGVIDRICSGHGHFNSDETQFFLRQFSILFPFSIDIREPFMDPTTHSPSLIKLPFSTSSAHNAKSIQLFACSDKSFRPIMPSSSIPHPLTQLPPHHHQIPGRLDILPPLHPIPATLNDMRPAYLPQQPLRHRIDEWRNSVKRPRSESSAVSSPKRKQIRSRSRYKNKRPTPIDTSSNNGDQHIHITHNHYTENGKGVKQGQMDNVKSRDVKVDGGKRPAKDVMQGQSKSVTDTKSTSDRSGTNGKDAKGNKGTDKDQKNHATAWIIGTIIAAIIIVVGCCCGVYAVVSGQKSQPSVQKTGKTENIV